MARATYATPRAKISREPAFRRDGELVGEGSYAYPDRWVNEVFVHAAASYLMFEAGLVTEEQARRQILGS